MEICRRCKGNCDSGELVGGICTECLEKDRHEQERADRLARMMNSPSFQMEMDAGVERMDGPGYREMATGVFVPEEDAFDYALENCFEMVPAGIRLLRWTQEFKEMLVEWFYSGNWIKED